MARTAEPSGAGVLEVGAGDLEAAAGATRTAIEGLLAAGCQLIRVDEPGLTALGDDDGIRSRVLAAHDRALPDPGASHLMLALTGGDATAIGASALAGMRYASFLFDLLRGPDSWRVVARLPAERGVVCGVVPTGEGAGVVKEAMVWAAHYAASTEGRGLDRVGLATAGDLGGLDWDVAADRVRLLGTAARIAADDSMDHLAMELDPRAVGMKSAAFGRNLPVPEPGGRRRSEPDPRPERTEP
jgi:methionine synthase II (cobalamin-independent)